MSSSSEVLLRLPRRRRTRPGRVVLHVVIVLVCIFWFTPVVQLAAVAFRTTPDSADSGWWTIVLHPLLTMDNYASGAQLLNLGTTIPSTLEMTLPAVVLAVLFSAYGGYVLAIYQFRGRTVVYGILVALMAVPPQLTYAPLVSLFSLVHLSGSIAAVWVFQVGYTIPFGVFLVRGFMHHIPTELLEAARVDGASDARIFIQVALPLMAPILASLGILQFMWSWNDLLTPLIFIGATSNAAPITLELAGLVQGVGTANQMNEVAAGAIIAILPPIVILVALQRYFVAGITGGAVKG